MARNTFTGAGLFIALGLIAAAFAYGTMQRNLHRLDRVVTVKGLVEHDVVADTVLWQLEITAAGDDLTATQAQLEGSIAAVRKFLVDKGFKEQEISLSTLSVFDRKATQYAEQREGQVRFIVKNTVVLRSGNVALAQSVARMTNELVRAGVVLSSEGSCNGPAFLFTKLNDIKPQMLAEATQNARKAAEQFAADSGSRVGEIKRAQQGFFTISERDRAVTSEEGNSAGGCNADPNKRVRVVTTVDYYLE